MRGQTFDSADADTTSLSLRTSYALANVQNRFSGRP